MLENPILQSTGLKKNKSLSNIFTIKQKKAVQPKSRCKSTSNEKNRKVSYKDMKKKWHVGNSRGYYHEVLIHGETFPGKLRTMKKEI